MGHRRGDHDRPALLRHARAVATGDRRQASGRSAATKAAARRDRFPGCRGPRSHRLDHGHADRGARARDRRLVHRARRHAGAALRGRASAAGKARGGGTARERRRARAEQSARGHQRVRAAARRARGRSRRSSAMPWTRSRWRRSGPRRSSRACFCSPGSGSPSARASTSIACSPIHSRCAASYFPRIRSRCDVRLEPELPQTWADPFQLQQVILNLLINAEHALRGQRGKRKLVPTHACGRADRIFATVSDNGPGISAESLGRVFEPFFTTKPLGEGTGLGPLDLAWHRAPAQRRAARAIRAGERRDFRDRASRFMQGRARSRAHARRSARATDDPSPASIPHRRHRARGAPGAAAASATVRMLRRCGGRCRVRRSKCSRRRATVRSSSICTWRSSAAKDSSPSSWSAIPIMRGA